MDIVHPIELRKQPFSTLFPPLLLLLSSSYQVAGDVLTAEIRDLQPGALYFFRVQAMNSQGSSAWSGWARLLTPSDAPAPPPALRAWAAGAGAVSLKWEAPECDNGAPVQVRGEGVLEEA